MGAILIPILFGLVFAWPLLLVEAVKAGFNDLVNKIGSFIDLDRVFGE